MCSGLNYLTCIKRERARESQFEKLFNSEFLSDVKFVFSGTKVIFAHSFVLSVRSGAFFESLGGTIGVAKVLPIQDPYDDYYELIKYLYTNNISSLTTKNIDGLLKLARRYRVTGLLEACSNVIIKELSTENACKYLEMSIDNDLESVRNKSLTFITENCLNVIRNHSFLDIKPTTLKAILELEAVPENVTEFIIFTETMKWAASSCSKQGMPATGDNKRHQLDGNLKLIRFGAMKPDKFGRCQQIAPGLLTNDEISAIYLSISKGKSNLFGFSHTKRVIIKKPVWRKLWISLVVVLFLLLLFISY